ncbi:DedA family protein [Candidatus Microgenomates bacterium]|nr:MAG: DedA family protein [Candidatus Microgenomates bacterium]
MKKEKIIAVLIFILSLILSASFFIFKDYLSGFTSLGLLGLFLINFVSNASLFISAPAFLSVIAGGSMYSPLLVALVSSLGAGLGDMVGYALGLSGRKIINHKLEKKIWFRVFENYFKKYGSIIILVLAFVPNPFFDAMGIFVGISGYSAKKFFLLILIGRFVRFLLLAYAGKSWF